MKGQIATEGVVYAQGEWHVGNPKLLGPRTHGVWLGSVVFDGARYFDGVAPDLLPHCERAVTSARVLGMQPQITGAEIAELAWEGIRRFPRDSQLYICPMFWGESGFIVPDSHDVGFGMSIYPSPLPPADGFKAMLSSFRRPARDMAPTEAKASCLYPNTGRAVAEAKAKGCDTAVMLDPSGNVAEFAYTNLFFGKGGVVHTPAPNGTFLNGLTRQRVIKLLRDSGVTVEEHAITWNEVLGADEVFATGNYQKLGWCKQLNDRTFMKGPLYERARELYFAYAREHGRP
ncbi:Branched-chain amino acid aminotransferase [Caenispirillum salinarum AK4]|uniref:Probable branched-chain-amino-acid aminotransferase n=1 Tax=Caenispirillum salinarum AK4 TaxID=1238182 RepID=K9GPK0_9PROT|nr:branched-chain amino acid aminotransferase [Caenispirillum salinarum]EKV27047.1 Branched-chain amino acid aminotransferase [Caenispirillum salinarum AK4]